MSFEVKKRGNGWTYRVYYYDDKNKRKSVNGSGFKRKADAVNEAKKLDLKNTTSSLKKSETVTFSDFFEEWMNTFKIGRFTVSTDNKYIYAHNCIEEYFSNKLLKDINRMNYQGFIDDYAKKHVKDSISRINGYIRACLREAIDEHLILSDFTRNIVITTDKKGKNGDVKYLEIDEAKKLKQLASESASLSRITSYEILFALDTGARYAEVVGMTWDCIDLKNNTISINKTYDYKKRTGFLPTKTESSVREITISPILSKQLSMLKLQQQKTFLKQGYKNKDNFVFINNRHEVPTDTAANKALRNYLDIIKTKNRIGFHGLRHTHASILISKHVSLEYVSKRLGHSNVGITSKVYVHLLDEYKKEEDQKAMNILSSL